MLKRLPKITLVPIVYTVILIACGSEADETHVNIDSQVKTDTVIETHSNEEPLNCYVTDHFNNIEVLHNWVDKHNKKYVFYCNVLLKRRYCKRMKYKKFLKLLNRLESKEINCKERDKKHA